MVFAGDTISTYRMCARATSNAFNTFNTFNTLWQLHITSAIFGKAQVFMYHRSFTICTEMDNNYPVLEFDNAIMGDSEIVLNLGTDVQWKYSSFFLL